MPAYCPRTSALALLVAATLTAASSAAEKKPDWSYQGDTGPDHWATLSAGYSACGSGRSQSPIDLTDAGEKRIDNVEFRYQPTEVTVAESAHTIKATVPAGSHILLDGKRFDLKQFHFHAPSEHRVDGKLADGELHLVHQGPQGTLAVVGLMLEKGDSNRALAPLVTAVPEVSPDNPATGVSIDTAALLPEDRRSYRYLGSLTTPPCSEGVRWIVMTAPVSLSSQQLEQLAEAMPRNNRPVQPLNDRTLLRDISP